jgi:beta-aspartyl-dipeptidase (metallo-type)
MLIIPNGTLYSPQPRGKTTIVVAGGRIEHIGEIDAGAFKPEVLDAAGCIVAPGLIDPHVHLIGGSGEEGFATQTPEISAGELLRSGITTVVGVLGTDTTTRTLPALLARVKALREEGLAAWMWTGGYDVPPKSITGAARDDIILIEEVIGIGETAIADRRSMEPTARELARLATDCLVAGSLTGKAGVLHLHVGEGKQRLALIREAIDEFDVVPATFYPTHVERNEPLMLEAVQLTKRGVPVDVDVYEEDLAQWVRLFINNDGDRALLTASTDSAINSPHTLLAQVRDCVQQKVLAIEDALALVTANPARILKLRDSGVVERGRRADLLLLDEHSLELRHVVCGGEIVMRDGRITRSERFLKHSNRRIHLEGEKPWQ